MGTVKAAAETMAVIPGEETAKAMPETDDPVIPTGMETDVQVAVVQKAIPWKMMMVSPMIFPFKV